MKPIVAVGELLVDFLGQPAGRAVAEAHSFVPAPGGAPANVVVGAARLGASCAFLGKVGDDPFGERLARVLREEGVDVTGLRFDAGARTALAFVAIGEGGEREFSFYRHPSADMLYRTDEVETALVRVASVLHFGSISLISEPSRSATLFAVEEAKRAGAIISFDPNLRLDLWPAEDEAREGIRSGLERAQVVKLSEQELAFLTGSVDPSAGRYLLGPAVELLVVTLGPGGAYFFTPRSEGKVAGFKVEASDTTGAGDAFMASLLADLSGDSGLLTSEEALQQALRRANASAAITVTRPGAIPALPTSEEVQRFLAAHGEEG